MSSTVEIFSNKDENELMVTVEIDLIDNSFEVICFDFYVPAIDSWVSSSKYYSEVLERAANQVALKYLEDQWSEKAQGF